VFLGVALVFGLTVLTMAYAVGHISGRILIRNCAEGRQRNMLNPWVVYGLGATIILAVAELGRLIGISWRHRHPEAKPSDLATLVGAALGLLSLMIGFTFSMALNRYDDRRSAVVDEANAIGTTDLRARMLPEPHASEVRKLLRDYVEIRIGLTGAPQTQISLEKARQRSNALQAELWQHAVAVSTADLRSTPAGLFVRTLNDMIDLQEKRFAAVRAHVPLAVFVLLYTIAGVAIGLGAYVVSSRGQGGRLPIAIMGLLFAVVIGMTNDLDRSLGGFITVDQQSMYKLRENMNQ
jgi:hypothetical protein